MMTIDPLIVAIYTRQGYPSAQVAQYAQNYAGTNVNTLIISGPNGDPHGIVYNNYDAGTGLMFNLQGQYVGDPGWPASLAELAAGTNILSSRIFLSLSNSAISTLASMTGAALAAVMGWLKASGIAGIDMDCENWGQPGGLNPMDPAVQTVTAAVLQAGLALTAAPYNQMDGWVSWNSFVVQKGGTVSWFNLQCYAGGAPNDPQNWIGPFNPPVPIVPGIEANPGPDAGALTPDQASSTYAGWQSQCGNALAGGFVWEFSIITSGSYTVAEYGLAIYQGLSGQSNTVTVTASDNELLVYAYQGNDAFLLARILSGYSNSVNMTLNIAAGDNKGPLVLNGVERALDSTATVCLPSFAYTLQMIGINWGGPTQFTAAVNGTAQSLPYNASGPVGVVWTPPGTAITV